MNLGAVINNNLNSNVAVQKEPQQKNLNQNSKDSFKQQFSKTNSENAPAQKKSIEAKSHDQVKDTRRPVAEKVHQPKAERSEINNNPVQFEAPTAKQAPVVDTTTEVSSSDEKAVLKTFLKKMEQEVGVEPQKLIDAFGKLSVEELLSPPEESMDTLIKALELPEDQELKAQTLFSQMLGLKAASDLAGDVESQNLQMEVDVLSKEDARKAELQKSLTTMSQQFFLNKPDYNSQNVAQKRAAQAYGAQQAKPAQIELPKIANFQPPEVNVEPEAPVKETPVLPAMDIKTPTKGVDISSLQQADSADVNELQLNKLLEKVQNSAQEAQAGLKKLAQDSSNEMNGLSAQFKMEDLDNLQVEDVEIQQPQARVQNMNTQPKGSQQVVAAMSNLSEQSEFTDGESSNSENYDSQTQEATLNGGMAKANKTNSEFKTFMVQQPQANQLQQAENTKEIINKAQFLVGKGGGEMKVTLNPAGVGEVNLKVMMQNGKVNVEMVADNIEVKNLIEKGLGDLKTTLAEHKLNLETIKVDVGNDLGRDLSDERDQAEQQFQQKFLQDFKRGNQQFKQGLMDLPFAREGVSQGNEDQVAEMLQASSQPDSSRRLNLIA